MTGHECAREREILDAVADGSLDASQREHVAGCDACAGAIAVAEALGRLAMETAAEAPPHDYRVAWLAARFAARQQRLARLDFLSAACLGAVMAFGLMGLALFLSPTLLDGARIRIPALSGGAAPYVVGAMLAVGGLGTWALWDRKLGARK